MSSTKSVSRKRKLEGGQTDESMSTGLPAIHNWVPTSFLSRDISADLQRPYVVVVLNTPIENTDVFLDICDGARFKIAADGGANRIRDLGRQEEVERRAMPDLICGDLDSIKSKNLSFYRRKGVQIMKVPDQNSTDFTKCLRFISNNREQVLSSRFSKSYVDSDLDVVVFGGLGGRADQAFSQLHHIYAAEEDPMIDCGNIYLFTPESIVFLLHKGENLIHTPLGPGKLGENIGIIPLAKPSLITTSGLEWDVTDWPTEFGTQISTSNHIKSSAVRVSTTERVLFTVELDKKQPKRELYPEGSTTSGSRSSPDTPPAHVNALTGPNDLFASVPESKMVTREIQSMYLSPSLEPNHRRSSITLDPGPGRNDLEARIAALEKSNQELVAEQETIRTLFSVMAEPLKEIAGFASTKEIVESMAPEKDVCPLLPAMAPSLKQLSDLVESYGARKAGWG